MFIPILFPIYLSGGGCVIPEKITERTPGPAMYCHQVKALGKISGVYVMENDKEIYAVDRITNMELGRCKK
jgi:hypothetical protein